MELSKTLGHREPGQKTTHSTFILWQCCKCHDAGMTVAATPGCPQCSHFRCDCCGLEQVELLASRAGAEDAPQCPHPLEWPFRGQAPLPSALTETCLGLDGIGDSIGFCTNTPESLMDTDSSSSTRGRSESPSSDTDVGTPATSLTLHSSPGSVFSFDEDGEDDDHVMERHIIGHHLWSVAPESDDAEDPFSPLINILFERYEQWRQRPTPTAQHQAQSHGHNAGIPDSPLQPPMGIDWLSFATSRGERIEESVPVEETEIIPPETGNVGVLFACPFWKRDCIGWRDCFGYKLKRIGDVRQHLRRIHAKYCYCDRCGQEFHTRDELNNHWSYVTPCQPRPFQRRWLSENQKEALANRLRGTPEEQWFAFWDVIFPRRPRPVSPYIDGSLSEDLSSFLDFFLGGGGQDIHQTLQPDNYGYLTTESHTQHLLRLSLRRRYDQWASARGHSTSIVQVINYTADTMPPPQVHMELSAEAGPGFENTAESRLADGHERDVSEIVTQETDYFPGSEFINFDEEEINALVNI